MVFECMNIETDFEEYSKSDGLHLKETWWHFLKFDNNSNNLHDIKNDKLQGQGIFSKLPII